MGLKRQEFSKLRGRRSRRRNIHVKAGNLSKAKGGQPRDE